MRIFLTLLISCLLSAGQHYEGVFLVLLKMQQKLRMWISYIGLPKILEGLFYVYLYLPTQDVDVV
jgi:hypothetical protein